MRPLHGPAGLAPGNGPEGIPRCLDPVDFDPDEIAGENLLNPVFSSLIKGPDDGDDGKVSVETTMVRVWWIISFCPCSTDS